MRFSFLFWAFLLGQLSSCVNSERAQFAKQAVKQVVDEIGSNGTPTPVVMYHGMGDTAYGSINEIKRFLEAQIPQIYVTSIQIGNNVAEDFLSGFFRNLNDQVSVACSKIASDPGLAGGYNAIGFSQGGQILRAIAQRCPSPPMRTLISIGGQHQGVYGLPRCFGDSSTICDLVRRLIAIGAYDHAVQSTLVQAQYWHDPRREVEYRDRSTFLADINNEREPRNQSYAQNLAALRALVLVKFRNESIVEPADSEWFEFYAPGQSEIILPLERSPLYLEDRIGLRQLDRAGRLHRLAVNGDHLRFTLQWFRKNIVDPFLRQ